MTNQVIPEDAVEAAAEAAYEVKPATYYLDDSVITWARLRESHSGQFRKDQELRKARAVLEAAAPHMTRVIASADQLDALPAGSVVMGFDADNDQLVSRKSSHGIWEQAGTDDGWQAAGIIQWHGSVTVIHEPTP